MIDFDEWSPFRMAWLKPPINDVGALTPGHGFWPRDDGPKNTNPNWTIDSILNIISKITPSQSHFGFSFVPETKRRLHRHDMAVTGVNPPAGLVGFSPHNRPVRVPMGHEPFDHWAFRHHPKPHGFWGDPNHPETHPGKLRHHSHDASVPEPATLAVVVLGSVAAWCARLRAVSA